MQLESKSGHPESAETSSSNGGLPSTIPILIDGRWRRGRGGEAPLRDKFTGAVVSTIALPSREEIAEAVRIAVSAARKDAPGPFKRGEILDRAALLVDARQDFLGQAMQVETGFTTADVQGEIRRCVQTLRLCAEEARRFCGEVVPMEGGPGQDGRIGLTLRVPLGVVCAITPFNAPLNILAHKVAPALAAGNAVIVKPSLHVPFTANLLADILLEAGLPPRFISVLHGGAETAQWLLAEQDINFFAFTGSTEVGRQIQKSIGLRRSQLELGSIAHTVVDEGTSLERALPLIVNAAYRKAGQVCASIQVLLVHERLYEAVVRGLTDRVATMVYGAPSLPKCVVGPLISEEAAVRVEQWIQEAVAEGAERVAGGERVGSVVPPTLLTGTSPQMKVRNKEVFGPVLSVVAFSAFEQALEAVNSTPYGLSAGVFTNFLNHAILAAKTLRTGVVHVNETSSSRADLMPFGGSKNSGFGREGPRYAIKEMSEERLITITT